MDKLDNPYFSLLEIMKNQSPTVSEAFIIGTVVNSNPLAVEAVDNIVLDREDILINDSLLSKYNQKVSIKTSSQNESGEIELLEDILKVGDKVVLLSSQDQQKFILIARVV